MSVVVLNMEMPRACIDGHYYGNCPMDRLWCAQRFAPEGRSQKDIFRDREDKVPDWCPIRHLPEKHGRLGDLDAIMNKLAEEKRDAFTKHDVWLMLSEYGAPTIIEAEGGSDG